MKNKNCSPVGVAGKIKNYFFAMILFLALVFVFVNIAFAAVDTGVDAVGTATGLGTTDVRVIIGNVIKVALGLLGAVALGFVLYGGFVYMTAGGVADKTTKAKKILINAGIGLVIIFSAYAITSFVISKLTTATGVSSGGSTVNESGGGLIVSGGATVLVANSITPQGQLSINNVKVRVMFSRAVAIDSINSNSLIVSNNDGGAQVNGTYGVSGRIAVFTPESKCEPPHSDANCFAKNATFKVTLKPELIRSASGNLSLTCATGSACVATFTTGENFDATAPTVDFLYPKNNARVSANDLIEGQVMADDDSGVSAVSVFIDNELLATQMPIGGFSQAFTTNFYWDTADGLVSLGNHALQAKAKDIDGHETTAEIKVKVLPETCFNNEGGLICGSPECGSCDGSGCTSNNQCVSGLCLIPPRVCASLPTIASIAPKEGAVGNLVSIFGSGFGAYSAGKSKVYFSKSAGQYAEATLGCVGKSSWSDTQIIAKVPAGAISGPIKIVSADNKYDTTDNDRGWKGDFIVDEDLKYPGLCSINRENCDTNCSSGLPGQKVTAVGQGFGALTEGKHVYFGTLPADLATGADWQDAKISGISVPSVTAGLLNVAVGTGERCLDNNNTACASGSGNCTCVGIYSNPIQFRISSPTDLPTIQTIAPNSGAAKQLITITGVNFGNAVGRVEFVSRLDDARYPAELSCGDSGWSDNQIAMKVPANLIGDKLGNYDVFVYTANNRASGSKQFAVNNAGLTPGLCALFPDNGPIGTMIKISGENLGDANKYSIKFTKTKDATVPAAGFSAWSDIAIEDVLVPSDAVSGAVYLLSKATPAVSSNKLQFKVGSCKADADCATGRVCCDTGVCLTLPTGQTKAQTCTGQSLFKPSEFGWVLSTGALPKIPRVLERSCVTGYLSQSPSPAKASEDACPNGTISATFNMLMDSATFANNVVLKRCTGESQHCDLNACQPGVCSKISLSVKPSDIHESNLNIVCQKDGKTCSAGSAGCVCVASGQITEFGLVDSLVGEAVDSEMVEKTGAVYNLIKNTWYQVEIKGGKNGVKSATSEAMPNDYKWEFRTKNVACQPDNLLMSPAKGVIKEISAEQSYLVSGQYKCQTLALTDKPWAWGFETATNKAIVKPGIAGRPDIGVYGISLAQINQDGSAKINLETPINSPIKISANVPASGANTALNKTGDLAIEFASAKVVNYFPKCQAACPNAMIGASFSSAMRESDFSAANIKLYACSDSNCTGLTTNDAVNLQNDATIKYQASAKEVQISLKSGSYLAPNKNYRVVLANLNSATGKPLSNLNFHALNTAGSENNAFSWTFKTKNDADVCQIASVNVQPANYKSRVKGEVIEYLSGPRSSPDSCDSKGQALDPFAYSWTWFSDQPYVAAIGNVRTNNVGSPYQNATINSALDIKAHPEIFQFNQTSGVTIGSTRIQAVEEAGGKSGHATLAYETSECVADPIVLDMSSSSPINNAANVCRNALVYLTFTGNSADISVSADNVKLLKLLNAGESCDASSAGNGNWWSELKNSVVNLIVKTGLADQTKCEVANSVKSWVDNNGALKIIVAPSALLEAGRSYQVLLTGIKNKCGQAMANKTINFNVGSKVCLLNNVAVDPADQLATQANQAFAYQAFGKSDSQVIQPFADVYSWKWTWKSLDESIAKAVGNSNNALNDAQVIVLAKNGTTFIKATATVDADTVSPESTVGSDTVGVGQLQVFICDNVWYPDYSNQNANWGKETSRLSNGNYVASYLFEKKFDLGLFYCRDFGQTGTSDDLPKLTIATDSTINPNASDLLGQYFFTRNAGWSAPDNDGQAGDVISLRIYKNLSALSPEAWYKKNVPNPAASVTNVDLDCISDETGRYCFAGSQDGPSLYMAGPNVDANSTNIYNNIYLLGYSRGASAATQNIYSQLVNFVKFNVQRADSIDKKLALRRDMKRLADKAFIVSLINKYKSTHSGNVPQIESGSYVAGRTFSVWPSWQNVLGNSLGASLPIDPLNHFQRFAPSTIVGGVEDCGKNGLGQPVKCAKRYQCVAPANKCVMCIIGYDKNTCYNSAELKFYDPAYANPDKSPLYHYRALSATSYELNFQREVQSVYSGYYFVDDNN